MFRDFVILLLVIRNAYYAKICMVKSKRQKSKTAAY